MKWYFCWAFRCLLSYLPFSSVFRYIKRRFVPYNFENADDVLDRGLSMIESIEACSFTLKGKVILELGSGWEPIIPLLFCLKGSDHVNLIDRNRLIEVISLKRCLSFLSERAEEISTRINIPPEEIRDKLVLPGTVKTVDDMLLHFHLHYYAPCDARSTCFQTSSIDVITSHTVLEHIPPSNIEAILTEFHRIMKPLGKTCHIIDNTDHYFQRDKSITVLNFLRFGDFFWKIISFNSLDYQNRLRHHEYLELFKKAGFDIVLDRSAPIVKSSHDTIKVKVAAKYRAVSLERLSMQSFFVAKKSSE